MSVQRKTHLVVHGVDRTMVEKMITAKRMFNFEFTVIRESDYEE